MSMIKITAVFALFASVNAIAGGLYRDTPPTKLTYKQEGKAVCFNTMIGIDEESVEASIHAKLQEVRGKQIILLVDGINIKSERPAPTIIMMNGIAFRRGDQVTTEGDGWIICE